MEYNKGSLANNLSKQESIHLINTLLKNSENKQFLEKIVNENIEKIGQHFFDVLEEAIENAEYEGKYESAEFLTNLGETLFEALNIDELDDFIEKSFETLYSSKNIDKFIEENIESFSAKYIHTTLAEIEHIAIDYGEIETAFFLLDRVAYLVKKINMSQPYLGFVYMCRVNILNDYDMYNEALLYLDKAISYFEKNSYEIAEALSTKGSILEDIKLIKESNSLFHKLRKQETIHCDSLISNYKILGTLYQKEGNFYKASKYLNLAMDLTDKSEIFLEVKLELLLDYSSLKIEEAFYSEALNYLYYIYIVSKKFNYYRIMYESLYRLSNIFIIIGDFEEAREYIIKASEINNRLNKELNLAYCYYILGVIELNIWQKNSKTRNIRKAIVSFNRAIKLLKKTENKKLYSEILYEIGVICKEQGYLEKAIKYFNESLSLTKSYNYKSYIYSELALLYASIDEYKLTFEYLDKADTLIDEGILKERVEFYFIQGQVYFMQNRLVEAWESFKKTIALYEKIGSTMLDRKMVYFGDKSDIFLFSISVAIELKQFKEAFETLEKTKSKYFLEILQRRNIIDLDSSLEYEMLIAKIEDEDDMEEIFKLRKKIAKFVDEVEINVEHLSFRDVKRLL